jgi:hypothetical protein
MVFREFKIFAREIVVTAQTTFDNEDEDDDEYELGATLPYRVFVLVFDNDIFKR